jgi:signal transduction histidine kinase
VTLGRQSTGNARIAGQPSLLWLGWLALVSGTVAVFAVSLPHSFESLANPPEAALPGLEAAYISARAHAVYHTVLDIAFAASCIGVSALLLSSHGRDRLAVLAAFAVAAWGATNGVTVESVLYGGGWRWVLPAAGWTGVAVLLAATLRMNRSEPPLRRRQQVRWCWYGIGASTIALALVAGALGTRATLGADEIDRHMTAHALSVLAGLVFPAALWAGWLHSGGPDPDTLIRRTLVYGGLTAIVVGASIVFVILPVFLYPALGGVYALAMISVWAVVGLQLQVYLQRLVNRLLYGQREEPMSILNDLGGRLELGAPETILSTIVETVASALKLPGVTIEAADGAVLASSGTSELQATSVPVVHQREQVGRILAHRRSRDEPLNEHDLEVLRLVARQAGPTVRAVQLNQELRRSRRDILTSREEERRRIRRDLHDGLGPALAAIAMQADTARAIVREDPAAAEQLLEAVTKDARDVVAEVRRLVYDLRPPALDELGLAGAIERLALQHATESLRVRVVAAPGLPPMDAATEVAVYRIVSEALTNVVRHSGSSVCTVRIGLDETTQPTRYTVAVEDNGCGLSPAALPGIGLRSMTERAGEVSGEVTVANRPEGGTIVSVRVPVRSSKDGQR